SCTLRPANATYAWPAGWRSTASRMAAYCGKGRSMTSGYSRLPATQEEPSARPTRPGTSTSTSQGWCISQMPWADPFWGPNSRMPRSRTCSGLMVYRIRVFGDSKYVETARRLAEGKVVGWFQGRMEFGPRALGARSILADPRGRDVQKTVNLKIKFR